MGKSKCLITLILYILFLFLILNNAVPISLAITGRFSFTQDWFQLTTIKGGADFTTTRESSNNNVRLAVSRTYPANVSWRIDVKKVDTNWIGAIPVEIKMSDAGIGSGIVTGSTDYFFITDVNRVLCCGNSSRSNIGLRFRISALSAANLNSGNYHTTIYYTVTEF